jgi:hypothetical protein
MHGRSPIPSGRAVVTDVVVDVNVRVGEYTVVLARMVEVLVVVAPVETVEVIVTVGEYAVVLAPVMIVVGTVTVGEKIVETRVEVRVVDVVCVM